MANTKVPAELLTLPAIDLNDLSNATVSSSDPTVTTNPSGGVGTLWVNSTSGEAYICIDAIT